MRSKRCPGEWNPKSPFRACDTAGETRAATDATVIHRDDRLAVVGTHAGLDQFERVIGQHSDEDLVLTESNLTFRRVVVTDRDVLGKTVGELDLDDRFGVAVTRVTRADIEMSAVPGLRLQFGDMVQIVGATPISTKPPPRSATRSRSSTKPISSPSSSASLWASRLARCRSLFPGCLSPFDLASPAVRLSSR